MHPKVAGFTNSVTTDRLGNAVSSKSIEQGPISDHCKDWYRPRLASTPTTETPEENANTNICSKQRLGTYNSRDDTMPLVPCRLIRSSTEEARKITLMAEYGGRGGIQYQY